MSPKHRYILIFFIIFCTIYLFRFKAKTSYSFKAGETIKITAKLTQEPILQDNSQTLSLAGITIKTARYPEYHYGDQLIVVGKVDRRAIASFLSQFSLINPAISYVQIVPKTTDIFRYILIVQKQLISIIQQSLPEPHASLLIGIVLGRQGSLPKDFYESLKTTGTMHMIVASGMNLTLVVSGLWELLSRWLHRKMAVIVILVYILIYSFMTGMNPPIVRAAIMVALSLLATVFGRGVAGVWALLISAAIMLLINPLWLLDAGFQLSFTATLGLVILSPKLQTKIQSCSYPAGLHPAGGKMKFLAFLAEPVSQTLAAQIFTLPILMITFGRFNPLSIIPNLLVIWLIPYLMVLGFVICLIGLVFWPLAQFVAWLVWLPLSYFIGVINLFGQTSWFNLNLPHLSCWLGIGYYCILMAILKRKND